jgi:GNAT superfamily N-acetyltransferase
LTDAYFSDVIMGWCLRGLDKTKQEDFLHKLFNSVISTTTLQSRDFAIQVDGCKGVLVWTNNHNSFSWPRVLSTAKLARLIGWVSALRAVTKIGSVCDKVKKTLMVEHPHFITIGYTGILPHEQRKGYGSALVKHVLDKADDAKQPVYVEACDPNTVLFFEKFGFTVHATIFIANRQDLPVAAMVRMPSNHGEPNVLRIRPGRTISELSL